MPPARSPDDPRTSTYAQPAPTPPRSGLSVSTLAVAAIASVAAAVVTSKLWQGGTLISTAMTPVIVALVKEFLDRPATKITEVSSRAVRGRIPVPPARAPRPERFGEPDGLVAEVHEPARGPGSAPTPDEPQTFRVYGARRNRWRLAVVTGVIAFVVVAAVITLPELVAGRSIFDNRDTTLFGGHARHHEPKRGTSTTTTTVTTTTTTATQTVTTTVPQTTPTTTVPQQTAPTTTAPQQTVPTTTVPPPGG